MQVRILTFSSHPLTIYTKKKHLYLRFWVYNEGRREESRGSWEPEPLVKEQDASFENILYRILQ